MGTACRCDAKPSAEWAFLRRSAMRAPSGCSICSALKENRSEPLPCNKSFRFDSCCQDGMECTSRDAKSHPFKRDTGLGGADSGRIVSAWIRRCDLRCGELCRHLYGIQAGTGHRVVKDPVGVLEAGILVRKNSLTSSRFATWRPKPVPKGTEHVDCACPVASCRRCPPCHPEAAEADGLRTS